MAASDPIGLVLFDLGGVLIDPGGVGPMRRLSGMDSDDELWARWLGCRWVRRFESGACSPEEFAVGVVADWGLDLEPAAFLAAFGSWPGGTYPGALELVGAVRRRVPTGCLSNTNAFHWFRHFDAIPLLDAFDYRFLSFELGMVKPDLELFASVGERLPLPPGRVLFLDDNAVNVEGARMAGFVARLVRGVGETRVALAEEGLLAE